MARWSTSNDLSVPSLIPPSKLFCSVKRERKFNFICARASDFFSRLVGQSDPWSKKRRVIFWNDGPKHIKLTTVDIFVVYFTYSTLTADDTVKPFLSDHWKQKTNYCLMQVKSIAECSKGSILQYFWPSLSYHLLLRSLFFVFFEWLLKTCFAVLTTNMYFLFCGVRRLTVRRILFIKVRFFHN